MITVFENRQIVEISNKSIYAAVDYSRGLHLVELTNRFCERHTNTDRSFFTLNVFGKDYSSRDFVCESVTHVQDEEVELVTFLLVCNEACLKLRLHIMDDHADTIRILYQLYDGYKTGVPSVIFFHAPLVAQLEAGGQQDEKYYPALSVADKNGQDVLCRVRELFYSADIIMPLVVCDPETGYGFSVSFPVHSDLSDLGSVQNVDKQMTEISCEDELQNHSIRVSPDASYNDTVELVITGLKEGWPEAFDRCREQWQINYDFSEYNREDLQWFAKCPVHNFTFLYGKEGFDHETLRINVEHLVQEGEEFGGFDTAILWCQYPRLGIDERTQWDFYDDFPGGREAIREAVDRLHQRGVRVLLPFIPWDRNEHESTDSMGDELARIAADTGIDGFHLDTMKDLAYSVREKLDAVHPGIILETQSHPMKKRPMEFITTSWDEFWHADPMPEVDVLRFMHPRHSAPVIGRWLRQQDKDTLIKRAEFGGAPIVIWQDIFGRWMPYSSEQKKRVANWKKAYLKYFDVYLGTKPIPLYPTGAADIYCNVFQSDDGQSQIYSFYNDSSSEKRVDELRLWRFTGETADVVLGDGEASLQNQKLSVLIPAGEVLHVLVKRH